MAYPRYIVRTKDGSRYAGQLESSNLRGVGLRQDNGRLLYFPRAQVADEQPVENLAAPDNNHQRFDNVVQPGETIQEFIRRMHAPKGRCTCPREYSRCRWAVYYDRVKGDRSQGHGGWGWGD